MHKKFADIYDDFTKGIDYLNWYKFLRKYIKKKGTLVDIGCGTASITKMFHEDGFNVTGLDISKDMLNIAKKKSPDITYINDDITKKININKKFDYITCNFDTVNYFNGYKDLEQFIKNASSMQDENGILIFDLVLEEIFEEIFEDNIFIDEEDNYLAIWQYENIGYNKHNIEIDIFFKENDEIYTRYFEKHTKYIYDIEKVVDLLNKNSYYIYDMAKNAEYGEGRVFIIAKK
ncbi:class I SAM-dependent DNA methyltransferase [Oceanivirga salmonicida]|uniref:class I SAM-dependent DNA methyltransferase n=1 Tax=Oceanivirga salmonicida TaxID=1769291 RepID=UPI0012E282D4|nr:class I SAM-dependent methyltransferase [Oceanivirga salmonicida]